LVGIAFVVSAGIGAFLAVAQESAATRATGLMAVPAGASLSSEARTRYTFRGNGGKTLAPFRLARPSTLRWTASGGIFQIFTSGLNGGDVNSQAGRGASYMRPGRYKLTVNAVGSWLIAIAPGIERPAALGGGFVGFSGSGGRTLPPFATRRGTTLRWRASGGIFQLFSRGLNGPDVNSQARRGTTYMERGRHEVTVNALGAWQISWRP
jgi:hypothetical protein